MRRRTIEREKFLNVLCEESACPNWPEIKRAGECPSKSPRGQTQEDE